MVVVLIVVVVVVVVVFGVILIVGAIVVIIVAVVVAEEFLSEILNSNFEIKLIKNTKLKIVSFVTFFIYLFLLFISQYNRK